jgi:hypothetical protein
METVNIFVSYSHKNSRWCDEKNEYNLIPFIKDSLRYKNVQIWDDHDIMPGIDYEMKIKSEIENSKIAILMLSGDFINSEFIMKKELPCIKGRLENKQIEIIPILVEPWTVPSDHQAYWLLKNQIIPGITEPLSNSLGSHHVFLNKRIQILEAVEKTINLIGKGQIIKIISPTPPPPPPPPIKKYILWSVGLIISIFLIMTVLKYILNQPVSSEKDEVIEVLPLSQDEYRSKVLNIALLLKTDPIINSASQLENLKELSKIETDNPYYAKNIKPETAIINRLLGASIILSGQDPKIGPQSYFKEGFPFIKRSYLIDKEIWKSDFEKEAYEFFVETDNNIETTIFNMEFIQEYLKNVITAIMFSASKEEIDEQIRKLVGGVGPSTDVLTFFYNYKIGDTNYRLTVEAIKMLLLGRGSELKGPEIEKSGSTYQIKYRMTDANGIIKNIIWEVDMNKKEVTPFNEHAKIFTDAIGKKAN